MKAHRAAGGFDPELFRFDEFVDRSSYPVGVSNAYRTITRSANVIAWLTGVSGPFVDADLQRTGKEVWEFAPDELWTPRGLPLKIYVMIGAKNGVMVWSDKTKLLDIGPVDLSCDVDLWLPTDEVLRVVTFEGALHRSAAQAERPR